MNKLQTAAERLRVEPFHLVFITTIVVVNYTLKIKTCLLTYSVSRHEMQLSANST